MKSNDTTAHYEYEISVTLHVNGLMFHSYAARHLATRKEANARAAVLRKGFKGHVAKVVVAELALR